MSWASMLDCHHGLRIGKEKNATSASYKGPAKYRSPVSRTVYRTRNRAFGARELQSAAVYGLLAGAAEDAGAAGAADAAPAVKSLGVER
jgi:hypothetical protein